MKKMIQAESFIRQEDRRIPVDSLSESEQRDLSRWLRQTWLSELCRGRAEVVWTPKKDPAK